MRKWSWGRKIKDFRRDDDGSYTVELVLWFPAMMFAFQFVTDASVAIMSQQGFRDVARDASRMVALGQSSTADAQAFIYEALSHVEGVSASVTISNNFVTSEVAAPLSDIANLSGSFIDMDVDAKVSMWIENHEESAS